MSDLISCEAAPFRAYFRVRLVEFPRAYRCYYGSIAVVRNACPSAALARRSHHEWTGSRILTGVLRGDDNFGLDLFFENPSRIAAEERFG